MPAESNNVVSLDSFRGSRDSIFRVSGTAIQSAIQSGDIASRGSTSAVTGNPESLKGDFDSSRDLPLRRSGSPNLAEIYGDDTNELRALNRARVLVIAAEYQLTLAGAALRDFGKAAADDHVIRVQASLPEMFLYRGISEGYGAIVLSVYHALEANAGGPLDSVQIEALRVCFKHLADEPFCKIVDVLDFIDDLEEAGFTTDPAEAAAIDDIIDDIFSEPEETSPQATNNEAEAGD